MFLINIIKVYIFFCLVWRTNAINGPNMYVKNTINNAKVSTASRVYFNTGHNLPNSNNINTNSTVSPIFSGYVLPLPQFTWGGLYPYETPTREQKSLDGVWNFRLSPKNDPAKGFREFWFSGPLSVTGTVIAMPVPSSYNDITQDKDIREHIGWAWYDRTFYAPSHWRKDELRVVLRFGSIHYYSIIYLNGKVVTSHEGGHLPIMADVTVSLLYGKKNLLTVAVNNTLTPNTIPQGSIIHHDNPARYPPGYFEQKLNFDFFNYAGLHRPVFLYTTPTTYVEDIKVVTTVSTPQSGHITGTVGYIVKYQSQEQSPICSVSLLDANDTSVATMTGCAGNIMITNPVLWWPYLMNHNPGYQYTLWVDLLFPAGVVVDSYPVKVGIRELGWTNKSLSINGRPLYLRGCGKHEDADIRGKGYDAALVVKDFSLLKWLGANSFRTSHYPYAEEIMDRADAEGIMVIDESPAIGLSGFGAALLERHIAVMKEYLARDKNRPSVIMWSLGNEPKSSQLLAKQYFKAVVESTKTLDPTRPVTCVLSESVYMDLAAGSLDVIFVNRYFSWYTDTGHLDIIKRQTVTEFTEWHTMHHKPVGISEYGAGSLPGLHMSPSFTWSEEYQAELLLNNFPAFDELRTRGYFVGEMIWNFADFLTPQEYNRPAMCMKGLFSRNRQPKMAAFVTRARYWHLATTLECDNNKFDVQEGLSDINKQDILHDRPLNTADSDFRVNGINVGAMDGGGDSGRTNVAVIRDGSVSPSCMNIQTHGNSGDISLDKVVLTMTP